MTDGLLIQILILAASLYALMKGADLLVDNAALVARRYGLSEATIGLTLVAIGTSLPELVVSVISSWDGMGQLAYGNVMGSNIANVLLVVGITAMVSPISAKESFSTSDIVCFLLTGLLPLALLVATGGISGSSYSLGQPAGLAMLALALAFFYGTYRNASADTSIVPDDDGEAMAKVAGLIIAGFVLLVFGGQYTVSSAAKIAGMMGMSESFIGLSIVAFGTSLPELVTSIVAARKGKSDLAIGNVIGSNILNIALVLGTAAALSPMAFGREAFILAVGVAIITAIFYLSVFVWPRKIDRASGATWVVVYITYIAMLAVVAPAL